MLSFSIAHKLDYRSTPCMFLGYSSSHLGYHCLDLSSNYIYISCHVQFHEQSFRFLNFVYNSASTRTTFPPSLFSHLPSLTTFPSPNSSAPQTFPTNPSVPLPPSAFMSLDHFLGSGSAAPDLSTSYYPSTVVSLTSPPGIPLHPDFLLCLLQAWIYVLISPTILFHNSPHLSCLLLHQHHMVLRPRQHRTMNINFGLCLFIIFNLTSNISL